jgi:hypothetical protein
MSLHAINGNSEIFHTIKADFKSLRTSLKSAMDARKSGDQDQVSLSEDALMKAVGQFQTDVASLQGNTGGAMSQTTRNPVNADLKSLSDDLQAVSDAKKTGDQGQIDATQDTLQKMMQQVKDDITGMKKGHNHHHHHQTHSAYAAANGDDNNAPSAAASITATTSTVAASAAAVSAATDPAVAASTVAAPSAADPAVVAS